MTDILLTIIIVLLFFQEVRKWKNFKAGLPREIRLKGKGLLNPEYVREKAIKIENTNSNIKAFFVYLFYLIKVFRNDKARKRNKKDA